MKRGTRKNVYILPKRKGRVEEFGPGKAGLIVCSSCRAMYFKKSWHASAAQFLKQKKTRPHITFALCPACEMIKNGEYEGLITINDAPRSTTKDITGLIVNFCTQAQKKDPMDRLISVKKMKAGIEVKTTENQLAHKLARHIARSFKGARTATLYGKNAHMLTRIEITFPKTT